MVGFDFFQVFGREGFGFAVLRSAQVEIVVKTIFDGRADGQFGFGKCSSTASAMTWAAEWRMRYRSDCS